MDTILTINAGSSSIKFELFGAPELHRRCRSQLAGIAHGPRISPPEARAAVPTDEELIVAHLTLDLLQNRGRRVMPASPAAPPSPG